jgi:SAM-dependent methyltransferase
VARKPRVPLADEPRIRVFDRIAWIYSLLFHVQRLAFRRSFAALRRHLALPRRARVLDIGCGTAAHASVLAEWGHDVRALDASPRMIAAAERLLRRSRRDGRLIPLSVGNPLAGLDFPSRRFDLVLAAHVLHGMPPGQRLRFCREARRVSEGLVLIYDYAPRGFQGPRLLTRVLEALERSDYRRFRRSGLGELRGLFAEVEVLAASPGSAWYLCRSLP